MRYGNYCGPYWSDGAYQTSVVGTSKAVDEFDETCRLHDAHYAQGHNLVDADFEFFRSNVGKGTLRTVAGGLVGVQGALRWGGVLAPNNNSIDLSQTPTIMTKSSNLRGSQPLKQQQTANAKGKNSAAISTSLVPAAIGTTMRSIKPKVVRSGNTARIIGRDYLNTVEAGLTTQFALSTTALLSPAYFASAYLGNLCRSYELYKWNKLVIHYVPAVATTTSGAILMTSSHSVTQPALSGEASTFLPRAMTQGNAVMGPIWEHNSIEIDCNRGGKCLVDPLTTNDIDDNIFEELQVYYSAQTVTTAGYLFAEYDCSFFDPVYQPHSTSIPIPYGPGVRCELVDASATGAIGDDWELSISTGLSLSSVPNGTIFRGVVDYESCITPTGATLNNLLYAGSFIHATTSTFASATANTPIVGGFLVYLVVLGSTVRAYATIEAARAGLGSGQLFLRTAYTAPGTYTMILTMVGLPPATQLSIQ